MKLLQGSLPPLNSLLLEREKEVELNKSQHYLNGIITTVTQLNRFSLQTTAAITQ